MLMFGLSSYVSGLAVYVISAEMLTVISGLLAGSAGVVWFIREGMRSDEEDYDSEPPGG
jgi:hypothetical protein